MKNACSSWSFGEQNLFHVETFLQQMAPVLFHISCRSVIVFSTHFTFSSSSSSFSSYFIENIIRVMLLSEFWLHRKHWIAPPTNTHTIFHPALWKTHKHFHSYNLCLSDTNCTLRSILKETGILHRVLQNMLVSWTIQPEGTVRPVPAASQITFKLFHHSSWRQLMTWLSGIDVENCEY